MRRGSVMRRRGGRRPLEAPGGDQNQNQNQFSGMAEDASAGSVSFSAADLIPNRLQIFFSNTATTSSSSEGCGTQETLKSIKTWENHCFQFNNEKVSVAKFFRGKLVQQNR